MTKKKSNGFTLFANSRRAVYEARLGRRVSAKQLNELSAADWKNLSVAEQTAWLSKPKTQCRKKTNLPEQQQQQQQTTTNVVQQELLKRTYKTGLDRQTARDEFYGNILWREKDNLGSLLQKKWAMVVLSMDGTDIANEIICVTMDKGSIEGEFRVRRVDVDMTNGDKPWTVDCLWDVSKSEDVNEVCVKMAKFLNGTCCNYILVPAHQQPELSAILNYMKEVRDQLHKRDTQSIRLDRLVCVEDAVPMLRKLNNLPQEIAEIDVKWKRISAEWQSTPVEEYARATCQFFLSSQDLPPATPKPFSAYWQQPSSPVAQPCFVLLEGSLTPSFGVFRADVPSYPNGDPNRKGRRRNDSLSHLNRPYPFQTFKRSPVETVSNWLANLTLDPSPVDEETQRESNN